MAQWHHHPRQPPTRPARSQTTNCDSQRNPRTVAEGRKDALQTTHPPQPATEPPPQKNRHGAAPGSAVPVSRSLDHGGGAWLGSTGTSSMFPLTTLYSVSSQSESLKSKVLSVLLKAQLRVNACALLSQSTP